MTDFPAVPAPRIPVTSQATGLVNGPWYEFFRRLVDDSDTILVELRGRLDSLDLAVAYMADTGAALVPGSILTTDAASYYECPADTVAVIGVGSFTNTGGACTVDLWIVRAGDATGAQNHLIASQAVAANAVHAPDVFRGQTLEAGDSIWARTSVAGTANLMISGRELDA